MAHKKVERRAVSDVKWLQIRINSIQQKMVLNSQPVENWQIREAEYKTSAEYEFSDETYKPILPGELWGGPDGTAFFKTSLKMPDKFAGQRTYLKFTSTAESMVSVNGKMVGGLDPNRGRIMLSESSVGGDEFNIELESYVRSRPDDERSEVSAIRGCIQKFPSPVLESIDPEIERLYYDCLVIYQVLSGDSTDENIVDSLKYHLDKALNIFDRHETDRNALASTVRAAIEYLQAKVYNEDSSSLGRLALVAHSHLDIAYFWQKHHAIRKNVRTCVIQLDLMDQFPEFTYSHSQSWLYEKLKKHYPEVYEQVKQRIKEGRWEIVGGMYVEPDGNVPSGESMVRQCLIGKKFFSKEFGLDIDTCWVPDNFGNSWILPQILAKSGIKYFISNKMSTWNDTNEFPHNTFIWRGIDGSEVFTCVPPVHFISWMAPDQLNDNWDRFVEKDTCGESMHIYGYGDGGSGATEDMLEIASRVKHFPSLPQTRITTAGDYLHKAFRDPAALKTWDGELYLEMHRGTYTSKAILKKYNRQCEFLVRDAEILASFAGLAGGDYPAEPLEQAWKNILLNQFHDIIPGSHIGAVTVDAVADYEDVVSSTEEICSAAGDTLLETADDSAVSVINTFSWPRSDMVLLDAETREDASIIDAQGNVCPTQIITDIEGQKHLACRCQAVPAMGYSEFRYGDNKTPQAATENSSMAVSRDRLENDLLSVSFDDAGRIVSIIDKTTGREVVESGKTANAFQLFEDMPGVYNAWDIVQSYKDKCWEFPKPHSVEVLEDGPLSVALLFEYEFSNSRLKQIVRLFQGAKRVDFETFVDWQERHRLLKVAFPVSILARQARYDLSYGSIERPTHENTTWDQAKFEVCGHKWADLSEGDYGVALLNDSKYGYDIHGNVMRLTLLKGPIRPDPQCDEGQHVFRYAIMPHCGDWREGGVVERAYEFNAPLRVLPGRRGKLAGESMMSLDSSQVKIEAVKQAEDGQGLIVRIVELYGTRGTASLSCRTPIAKAAECDLLENTIAPAEVENGKLSFSYTPFEIKTFRLQ
ncbi:MAG: alpha-mannosidase [Phycisphaerae bacterium]|nr:alpha-mannosidase [Phycisphaerae bacterium]